jgi:hypothetical protein
VALAIAALSHAVILWNQSGEMDMEFDGSGSDTRPLFGVLIITNPPGCAVANYPRLGCAQMPLSRVRRNALLLSVADSCFAPTKLGSCALM